MGFFRFRRSIKIAPGIRWNFGKRSSSISIGGKGFHYTMGTKGTRTTVGIPGTGVSYTQTGSKHQENGKGGFGCGTIILVLSGLAIVGSLLNRGDAGGKVASPSPAPVPKASATPEPFPDSQFWPDKVRVSKPVTFSGKIGNGIIKSTMAAGALLSAIPSSDHQSVILHNLDLMESVPIGETDFLERSRKNP